jgi:hypothetical protein
MKKFIRFSSSLFLISLFAINTLAITWFPKEFECPIDKEKNTFMVIGSYGSYIYSYPSKYQWLFFPQTDSQTYYLCKKCNLATFMWDFDNLPKDKLNEIKMALATVKTPAKFKNYYEVPVSDRLEIMEKVYPILAKTDTWWETFYRIKGYHYSMEGKTEKALESRKKSLDYISKFLKDDKNESSKKLLFYTSAAMKHFIEDDKGAIDDLKKALETKYVEKDLNPEELKNAEDGMNERIKEYITKIGTTKDKPRLSYKNDGHGH